jgi:site-specific DNA-methyltransferase (adenine-specific)
MNKIFCGDCLEILSQIKDNSVQLIVADPPYYLLNKEWDKKQWKTTEDYLNWCRLWFVECNRILDKDGSIYIFQDWRMVSEFVIELKKIFPYFRNWITWERNKGRASKTNFKSSKEEILYFSKSSTPTFHEQLKIRPVIAPYKNEDGTPKGWFCNEEGNRVRWTGVGNVWHYTPPVWSSKEEKPFHPTQKPLMMLERIIGSSSNEGDLVIDLFAGSGVASVMAKKLGRNFIGIESNKEYCKKINERLESFQ